MIFFNISKIGKIYTHKNKDLFTQKFPSKDVGCFRFIIF